MGNLRYPGVFLSIRFTFCTAGCAGSHFSCCCCFCCCCCCCCCCLCCCLYVFQGLIAGAFLNKKATNITILRRAKANLSPPTQKPKVYASLRQALGLPELLWDSQNISGSPRAALGIPMRPWDSQSSSGTRRAALGVSEPPWDSQGCSGSAQDCSESSALEALRVVAEAVLGAPNAALRAARAALGAPRAALRLWELPELL